jgi:hypothetical protein
VSLRAGAFQLSAESKHSRDGFAPKKQETPSQATEIKKPIFAYFLAVSKK